MKMLESDLGWVGRAGCWRANGLIQQAGTSVTESLNADLDLAGLGTKNTGIKIDAISLAGSGGENLGESASFGSKGGGVTGSGGAF